MIPPARLSKEDGCHTRAQGCCIVPSASQWGPLLSGFMRPLLYFNGFLSKKFTLIKKAMFENIHIYIYLKNGTYLNCYAVVTSWILLAFHLWFGDRHKLAWKSLKRNSLLINLFFVLMVLTLRRYLNCISPLCAKPVWVSESCVGRIWMFLMMQW